MRHSTKVKKAKEQFQTFNYSSRKCPICNNGFKSEECTHSHEDASDYLFIQYTNAIFCEPNNKK